MVTILKRANSTPTGETVVLGGGQEKPSKSNNPRNTKDISPRTIAAIEAVVKGGKSKRKALQESGFSPAVVNNPSRVFERPAVKAMMDPIVQKMIAERDAVLVAMSRKRKGANFGTLAMALRSLNHDIQLLGGNPTDRIENPLSEEHQKYLESLIERNK